MSLENPRLLALVRSPMTRILALVALVHLVGIGWGLPGSDGWDNDGVAPRDFLVGLGATFTPGRYYTYPPVHLAILAVLTLPIVLVAVVRAPSFALADLVGELLKVPYMTAISYVARLASVAMSLGIAFFLARIAEELRASQLGISPDDTNDARIRRVGLFTALLAGLDASLTYYAHTSNLDVPYLFWGTWALLSLVRAIARQEPRRLRSAFALAVLAVGTKDQAYAMFLVAVPAALVAWTTSDAWARTHRREVLKETSVALARALALFLVVDAVIVNPTGFVARVRFLTGSASQDFVEYTRDWGGRFGLVADAARYFGLQYPRLLAPLLLGGVVLAFVRSARAERRANVLLVAAMPLLVAVSFTVTFNWTSLRSNARFLLPQALMLSIYGGLALEAISSSTRPVVRWAGRATTALAVALALHVCVSVDANLLFDPRRDAEAWLASHVRPGDTVETYGHNVYLPRFPSQARVVRVGPEPIAKRNPMPGIVEVEGRYADAPARDARFIVLATGWGWRYLIPPDLRLNPGRQLAPTQRRSAGDDTTTAWFERLVMSQDAFQFVHESKYELASSFPVVDVHGTSARPVSIYERKPALTAPP